MAVQVVVAIANAIGTALFEVGIPYLIGDAIAIAVTAYGAYSVIDAVTKKPNTGMGPQDRKQMIRSPVAPRTIVYGRARVSGPIVYAASTGDKNKYLHLVIPLAGHEIDAVEEVWFNDDKLTLDADGNVISQPYGVSKYITGDVGGNRTVYGSAAAGANSYTAVVDDGEEFGGFISVTVCLLADYGVPVYQENLSFTVSGRTVNYTVSGSVPDGAVCVINYYVNRFSVTPYARIKVHLGADDQTADADLVSECSGEGWTTDHRLRGLPYLYVRLEYSTDAFPMGLPNVSAVIRGKKIYDPRSDTTAWSNNWALVVRDYLMAADGLGCASAEIAAADLTESADYADTMLSHGDGTVSRRYTIDGVFSTDQRPVDVLGDMNLAGAGRIVWAQGVYRIMAGMDRAATDSIGASDLRGPIRVQARTSRQNLINGVKATYINTDRWQEAEVEPFKVASYITQDGGETIYGDLSLHYTTKPQVAKHLAVVHLKRSRQGIVVEAPLNLRGFKLAVGQVVELTFAQLGWEAKKFTVENWRLAQDGAGVDVTFREFSGSDFSYDPSLDDVADNAPDTTLPSPHEIDAPDAPTISEELYRTVADTIKTRVTVQWDAPANAFPVEYQLSWWTLANTTKKRLNTAYTAAALDDIQPGAIFATVRAKNALGVWSEWSPAAAYAVLGKTAPPPAPDLFTIEVTATGARKFHFGMTDEPLDLAGYMIRYNSGSTASAWASQTALHDKPLTTSPFEFTELLTGTYTFTCKAIDTSGNLSTTGRDLTVTLNTPSGSIFLATEDARSGGWLG